MTHELDYQRLRASVRRRVTVFQLLAWFTKPIGIAIVTVIVGTAFGYALSRYGH